MRRFIFVHIQPSVRSLCLVFGLVFGLGIAPSFAQNSDPVELGDPWAGVEEMIVSGGGAQILTKVDTAAAIGFDAEILQAEGVSDIGDLAAFTPNLNIKTAFAAVNPTIFIRGVGLDDFNSNSSSAVAILQDGIYMNSPAGQLFGLFDVEHFVAALIHHPLVLFQDGEKQALSVTEMILERGGVALVRLSIDFSQGNRVNAAICEEAFCGADELSAGVVRVARHAYLPGLASAPPDVIMQPH